MKLINLTPHEIKVKVDDNVISIPPSGKVARVKTVQKIVDTINTGFRDYEDNDIVIPVVKTEFGEVEGLPLECTNCRKIQNCPVDLETLQESPCPLQEPVVIFIVSSLVAQAIAGRKDIVAPDTGPTAIRDEDGQIKAVTRFQRW